MDSEVYLKQKEADDFSNFLLETGILCTEFGVKWVAQRGQYQIIDRYKWFLSKIKYGF
jgi:hypothetical protein